LHFFPAAVNYLVRLFAACPLDSPATPLVLTDIVWRYLIRIFIAFCMAPRLVSLSLVFCIFVIMPVHLSKIHQCHMAVRSLFSVFSIIIIADVSQNNLFLHSTEVDVSGFIKFLWSFMCGLPKNVFISKYICTDFKDIYTFQVVGLSRSANKAEWRHEPRGNGGGKSFYCWHVA